MQHQTAATILGKSPVGHSIVSQRISSERKNGSFRPNEISGIQKAVIDSVMLILSPKCSPYKFLQGRECKKKLPFPPYLSTDQNLKEGPLESGEISLRSQLNPWKTICQSTMNMLMHAVKQKRTKKTRKRQVCSITRVYMVICS